MDSDDESTLEAVKAMQTQYSVFLAPHLRSQVMPDKILSCQIINCPWWSLMRKLAHLKGKEVETVKLQCIYRRFAHITIEEHKEMGYGSFRNCWNCIIFYSMVLPLLMNTTWLQGPHKMLQVTPPHWASRWHSGTHGSSGGFLEGSEGCLSPST